MSAPQTSSPRPNAGRFGGFVAALMFVISVISACAGDSPGPDGSNRAVGEVEHTRSTTTTSTTTTTTSTTTTTTLAPPLDRDGVPRVALTTTDIVVPVLSEVRDGLLVRTPCRNTAIISPSQTNDRVHVVLDPGHGGVEVGAANGDISEKAVNLEVALLAEQLLIDQGFDVVLTRYTDVRVPLLTRAEIADHLEADLLVSIHHQSSDPFPTSEQPGVEVFYQQNSEESQRFAGLLVEEARSEYEQFDIRWFTGTDAGAVYRLNADTGTDFYGMIRLPDTTAVLAEMGFLGNPEEIALLQSGELQIAEAQAIANAVVRWFTTEDPGLGYVEPSFALRAAGSGGGVSGCVDPDLGETYDLAGELADNLATE